MAYFPMCVQITGRPVILVGSGGQIREKAEKLEAFGPELIRLEHLTEADLREDAAFVVAGDLPMAEAEQIAALCARRRIPLNVVDVPRLCTFTFPSLIARGDLTVSVATGGKAPGLAACLIRRLERVIPEQAGALVDWYAALRGELRARFAPQQSRAMLRQLTQEALRRGRPLTREECEAVLSPQRSGD